METIKKLLPAHILDFELLQIEVWKWTVILLFFVGAYFLSIYIVASVRFIVTKIVKRRAPQFDVKIFHAISGPIRLAVAVLIFAIGIELLKLDKTAYKFFRSSEKVLVIVVATWFLFSLINGLSRWFSERLIEKGETSLISMLPLGRRAAKTAIVLLAGLTLLQNFGVNVTALLAGLGVGGIAIALAGQKTIENLFGGVMIVLDQPVRVGDWCRFGGIEGNVEDIGLRSTRVRTFDRSVISVPNSDFSQMQLENMTMRDRARIRNNFVLSYDTSADQLRYVLIEVRKILYAHPMIDPDPARVRLINFGTIGLEIEIYAYVLSTDSNEISAVREDIFLRVMETIQAAGTRLALPSQPTYVTRDTRTENNFARAAEIKVSEWRAKNDLCLPEFSKQKQQELANSLDYPPKGSVVKLDPASFLP